MFGKKERFLITDAKLSPAQDRRRRELWYGFFQFLRVPSLLIAGVFLYMHWWLLAAIIVGVTFPLPWIAVVIGNSRGEKKDKRDKNVYKPAMNRQLYSQYQNQQISRGGSKAIESQHSVIDHDDTASGQAHNPHEQHDWKGSSPSMTSFGPHFDAAAVRDLAPELAEAFSQAGFTTDGLAGHLGPELTEALYRGEPAAVARGTAGNSQLDTLIRFFLLHEHLPATLLADALGARLAAKLLDAGVALSDDRGSIYIALDIRPHIIVGSNRLVFSDVDASLVDHVPGADHVLGVGAASLSLLQSTPVSPVSTVLDLGTGSGVQLLGQLECARSITATDVHRRALDLAGATVAASGTSTEVELVEGSWFEPVAGRTFDRIVANPPFVVGIPEVGHVYRDSGLNLDGASELVVSQAVDHLTPGGTAHLLAAWVHTGGQTWQQRVASWLPDKGVAAWIIQRDVADPSLYVSTWLKDESLDVRSDEGKARSKAWLDHFHHHDVTGIGFGFVAIQKIAEDAPSDILAEEMPQHFSDPLGPEVEEYFARVAWLRDLVPGELEGKHFRVRPQVAKEEVSVADTDNKQGFNRAVIRLTRTDGPRWSHEVDEHLAAIVAGLSPHGLNLGETVGLYAVAHGFDEAELTAAALPAIIDMVRHGLLIPADLLLEDDTSPAAHTE